jgi:hypothetical protein
MDIVMIYGEITAAGHLVEISYTKPEHRKPANGSIIIILNYMPLPDLIGKPIKYQSKLKVAYLNESAYAKQLESDKKQEILELIRKKNEINEAVEITGLDYTEELAEITTRIEELSKVG